MITDPKVGDIVYLHPTDHAGWRRYYRGNNRYQIISVIKNRDGFWACRCRCLQTGEIVPPPPGGTLYNGTWSCYLNRDEFLSAAYHAKEEDATRATKETTT